MKNRLTLNQEFFDRGVKAIELLTAKGNASGVARNYARLPSYRFHSGLLLWRRGENPRDYIEQGVTVLEDNAPGLLRDVPEMTASAFHLEVGGVFAFLIGRPYFHILRPEEIEYPDGRLTVHLLHALEGRLDRPAMEAELEAFAKTKKHTLSVRTYRNYFDILERAEASLPLDDLVRLGGTLYDQRKNDAFYSGGPALEGGGPGNSELIDYSLGAVLKHISYEGSCVHAWRWGSA